jgi:hypothetical protein
MLLGVLFVLCLATVPLAGGRLGALAEVELRATWLLLAGLAAQILVISVFPDGAGALHTGVHLASYAGLAAFVGANWARVPFLWLIAAGGALNLVAIAANGGVMPADPDALAAAGIATPAGEFSNSTVVDGARLQFLGDVLWLPSSWPVHNVFSVGDVLILAGAFLALHTIGGSRLALRSLATLPPPAWRPAG